MTTIPLWLLITMVVSDVTAVSLLVLYIIAMVRA